ncbi:hypothetical protein CALCODRAFT_140392 [Calocera cornea HHB12733]|uniref:Uncharacterized protein n=1 Tax=Calocera cornea HHB12733 TaxID=1353952 RepID=A0A165K4N9_9BASI|nr:hypothetical protein CALCODRAFT_140392 [Calocera cornea HHB12733]
MREDRQSFPAPMRRCLHSPRVSAAHMGHRGVRDRDQKRETAQDPRRVSRTLGPRLLPLQNRPQCPSGSRCRSTLSPSTAPPASRPKGARSTHRPPSVRRTPFASPCSTSHPAARRTRLRNHTTRPWNLASAMGDAARENRIRTDLTTVQSEFIVQSWRRGYRRSHGDRCRTHRGV